MSCFQSLSRQEQIKHARAEATRRSREYRSRKKNVPDYRAKETQRKRKQREKNVMDTEKMDKIRNQNRIRQARYRQQPKMHKLDQNQDEDNQTSGKSGKRLTRAQHEKQKELGGNRNKNRELICLPPQKRDELERKTDSEKEMTQSTEYSSMTISNISRGLETEMNTSTNAIKQSAYRMKKKMPKSLRKFAQLVNHIVGNATPTKNNALKAVGISDSPIKAQKDLENYVSSLKTTLNNLKKKPT